VDFDLLAPDLRGFGESEKPAGDKPSDQAGAAVHGADMAALLGELGVEKVGLVAHDVGAIVAQDLARRIPNRIAGVFCFDCPYPGIGSRWADPGHLKEIWYLSFNQLPWAAKLIGASRDACATYIGHFMRHWSRNPAWVDGALDIWVDNFMQPGALQGGFNWYISQNASRLAMLRGELSAQIPIDLPTCVRWGDGVVLPAAWGDRLHETIRNLDFAVLPGVGHFPHRENPHLAATEIAKSSIVSGRSSGRPAIGGADLVAYRAKARVARINGGWLAQSLVHVPNEIYACQCLDFFICAAPSDQR
jgi:pimeloyl-ACP methyl ester carboxylesterase